MIAKYIGVVEYKDGKNQSMRTTYMYFLVMLYVIGVVAV
jgi:hypothetical protein